MTGELARRAIEEKREFFNTLAKNIWDVPETAFNEVRTSKLAADAAEELGFNVTRKAYDMPTSVMAVW